MVYNISKKVYSIWVCPNPTEKFRNTINKYSMQEESLYGEGRTDKKAGYDMLTLIMICLDGENISSENPLIELLSTIFTAELNTAEKKNIPETKFSIPMTVPIRVCSHKGNVRIFEHNFNADKAKIRRQAGAWQGFLTQYALKFAKKTCVYVYVNTL